jgi:hypothetical protein
MPNYCRECTGSVVDSHMFQHVRCRLKGRLTNRVHADRVPAVTTYHKSAAHNTSGRCVHVLRLLFNGCLRWALGQQPQTLVTAATPSFTTGPLHVGRSQILRACQRWRVWRSPLFAVHLLHGAWQIYTQARTCVRYVKHLAFWQITCTSY